MGLWSRLMRWKDGADTSAAVEEAAPPPTPQPAKAVELPIDPFVFECRQCGKVFEARRTRPRCPECDSDDVALMSD